MRKLSASEVPGPAVVRGGRRVFTIWTAALLSTLVLVATAFVLGEIVRRGIGKAPAERLWAGPAPLAIGTEDGDVPTVSVYLPSRWHSTGTAVVICPGGAYRLLMSSFEGEHMARWLNSFGVAAFVLKYRIAPRYHHPAPLLDAARAVRYVRYHSAQYGLYPDRIGIIGFSAGGHLASTLITHFDAGIANAPDPIDRLSSRPDFAILGYPIITFEPPWTHQLSVQDLLGPDPSPAMLDELSNERHVTASTPPTFLFHTNEDTAVPAENSALFYLALRRAGVPSELHIFNVGPHGAGLANGVRGQDVYEGSRFPAPRVPALIPWSALAEQWLRDNWLRKRTWSYSFVFRM